jgi:peptide/nickel transport system permease protein
MNKKQKHLSQFQIALQNFKQNKTAMVCLWVLGALYVVSIFADFLSPYSYRNEDRKYSYCQPTGIQLLDENNNLSWPFVYGVEISFDQNNRRVYKIQTSQKYPIKIFTAGDEYKILGLVSCNIHLFGVKEPGRIYLWGADSRGRDLFSRILYG